MSGYELGGHVGVGVITGFHVGPMGTSGRELKTMQLPQMWAESSAAPFDWARTPTVEPWESPGRSLQARLQEPTGPKKGAQGTDRPP